MLRALLVLIAIPTTASALCPFYNERALLLNSGVALPADGGLVIATVPAIEQRDIEESGGFQPGWTFRAGRRTEPVVIERVAPGLFVYKTSFATAELFDGKAARALVTRAASPPQLPAPAVTSIEHVENRVTRWSITVTATLETPAPADALALVVLDANTLEPTSFDLVHAGAREVVVYSAGKCVMRPNGTTEATPGARVRLRWIDRYGRLSPPSGPLVVAGERHGRGRGAGRGAGAF